MEKKTHKLTLKKECKNSFVYEPVAGTSFKETITTGVYISKAVLPDRPPQTVTLTLEY